MSRSPATLTINVRAPHSHRLLPGYVPRGAIPVRITDRRTLALFANLEDALAACRRTKAPVGVLTALIAGTAAALDAGTEARQMED